MKYVKLGNTNLEVSVVGLGTWQFGGEWGKTFTIQEADNIIGAAENAGITLIDTAECYGNHLSESLIGRCLKGKRDKWVVATKFGHTWHDFMQRSQRWSVSDVQQQLDDSLQALRTDYIDMYQFHSGSDDVFNNDKLWEMLHKQVEAGKIRTFGISISRTAATAYQAKEATRIGAQTLQVAYNKLNRKAESEILPAAKAQNLGVLARSPLASGLLSGKYSENVEFTHNDVRSSHNRQDIRANLQEVEKLKFSGIPGDIPLSQWALAWCLSHPAVHTVIPGAKNAEQVKSNAAAADIVLEAAPPVNV